MGSYYLRPLFAPEHILNQINSTSYNRPCNPFLINYERRTKVKTTCVFTLIFMFCYFRCASANKELENTVSAQTKEISKLNTQLMEVQLKYELSLVETTNSTQRYENVIQHMTNKIRELQNENRKQQCLRENERNVYETEMQKNYTKMLDEKNNQHQREMNEIHERLRKEQSEVTNSFYTTVKPNIVLYVETLFCTH